MPGVTEINSHGGEQKYQVELDPDKLVAYGIAVTTSSTRSRANNANIGGGYLVHEGEPVHPGREPG